MTTQALISRTHELAALFTQPAWHRPEIHGKYLEDGSKPMEAFFNDICQNLQAWATEQTVHGAPAAVFYRTADYWYVAQRVDSSEIGGGERTGCDVIWLTRYRNGSWERMDTWCNVSTASCIGKEFLGQHASKRLPLFVRS
jgi:hypothetical protein